MKQLLLLLLLWRWLAVWLCSLESWRRIGAAGSCCSCCCSFTSKITQGKHCHPVICGVRGGGEQQRGLDVVGP